MKKINLLLALLLSAFLAGAQVNYYQQCDKLVPNGTPTMAVFGSSTSLSADGTTAIFGAPSTGGSAGAAYVYTRGSCGWTNPVNLTGAGSIGATYQGYSVAISRDGNTAVIGGPADDNHTGAAWVFVKSGGTWTEQAKLTGTGPSGAAAQGFSAAISGDGNTVAIGGPDDDTGLGAVWIFTRSGTTWSQMGPKLVGSGAVGSPAYAVSQGHSVALSADGTTLITGGPRNDSSRGSVWIYVRSGNTWTQQVQVTRAAVTGWPSLSAFPWFGISVAISSDGNTAVIGAPAAASTGTNFGGAVVVLSRTGTMWSQQAMMVSTAPVGAAQQGGSVGISSDGSTVVIGGGANVFPTGAANIGEGQIWVWTRLGTTWVQQGAKYVGTGSAGNAQQGSSVAVSGDAQTIVTGGFADDGSKGAIWTFRTTPGTPNAVAQHDRALQIQVSPNPADEHVYLTLPQTSRQSATVTIVDAAGREVQRRTIIIQGRSEAIDLTNLAPGVYRLAVRRETGVIGQTTFVKRAR